MANNNLLPARKQNGFFNKIKNIFKSIFYKEVKSNQESEETIQQTNNDSGGSQFIENLKEKTDIESACNKDALEYIVKTVEENPETLEDFPIETLEDIDNYYTEKIQEVENEINKVKKTN